MCIHTHTFTHNYVLIVYLEHLHCHVKWNAMQVPVGVANFPKELFKVPRAWAEATLNVKQWSVFQTGG